MIFNLFTTTNRREVAKLYENAFKELYSLYIKEKKFNLLPSFLDYSFIKCNKYLENFLCSISAITSKSKTLKNEAEVNQIMKLTIENLNKIFCKHTKYDSKTLERLKMMEFYKLQPPQVSIYRQNTPLLNNTEVKYERVLESRYNPDLDNEEYEVKIIENNKSKENNLKGGCTTIYKAMTISEHSAQTTKVSQTPVWKKNPFLKRLKREESNDIHPIKKTKPVFSNKSI